MADHSHAFGYAELDAIPCLKRKGGRCNTCSPLAGTRNVEDSNESDCGKYLVGVALLQWAKARTSLISRQAQCALVKHSLYWKGRGRQR